MPLSSQLRQLLAVRETTRLLLQHPSHLHHFDVSLNELDKVCERVLSLISRDYESPSLIPFHSRWRHFDDNSHLRVKTLVLDALHTDVTEKVRCLIDLFVVSVLLDAGAGAAWKFKFSDGTVLGRSEGLALASLDWFLQGGFSSSSNNNLRVDADKLESITTQDLETAFQVSPENPLEGAAGRCALLQRLGSVLKAPQNAKFFFNQSKGDYRPGNLVDYVLANSTEEGEGEKTVVDVAVLWDVVMDGLSGIWPPTRTTIDGVSVGDVWPCQAMRDIMTDPRILSGAPGYVPGDIPVQAAKEGVYVVAFHKLSQWLTYSLMEPLSLLNCTFKNMDVMTGLAEYRNGGLLVDLNVIKLKPETLARGLAAASTNNNDSPVPRFEVHDDAVVEWRALTVALLDLVGARVQKSLNMTPAELPLVKVLEAGTWKLGREVAAELRPGTKGPPIDIVSDGTVF